MVKKSENHCLFTVRKSVFIQRSYETINFVVIIWHFYRVHCSWILSDKKGHPSALIIHHNPRNDTKDPKKKFQHPKVKCSAAKRFQCVTRSSRQKQYSFFCFYTDFRFLPRCGVYLCEMDVLCGRKNCKKRQNVCEGWARRAFFGTRDSSATMEEIPSIIWRTRTDRSMGTNVLYTCVCIKNDVVRFLSPYI